MLILHFPTPRKKNTAQPQLPLHPYSSWWNRHTVSCIKYEMLVDDWRFKNAHPRHGEMHTHTEITSRVSVKHWTNRCSVLKLKARSPKGIGGKGWGWVQGIWIIHWSHYCHWTPDEVKESHAWATVQNTCTMNSENLKILQSLTQLNKIQFATPSSRDKHFYHDTVFCLTVVNVINKSFILYTLAL